MLDKVWKKVVWTCLSTKVFLSVSNCRSQELLLYEFPPNCIWLPPWSLSFALCSLDRVDAHFWTVCCLKQFWCCGVTEVVLFCLVLFKRSTKLWRAQFPMLDSKGFIVWRTMESWRITDPIWSLSPLVWTCTVNLCALIRIPHQC